MGKSSRLTIVLAGARVFCLGMLALLLTLPCDSGAGAVNFKYNSFNPNPHFHMVPRKHWIPDTTTGCFYFDPRFAKISGRFLYPHTVPVLHPHSRAVKSFSSTFIYRLQNLGSKVEPYTGPGMAFIMFIGGSPRVIIRFNRTYETPQSLGDHVSDNHTFSAEKDFNDQILYKQIWIDYSEAHSRIDIYYANHKKGKGKPAKPNETTEGVHLSLKNKNMYIGFSTEKGIGSSNVLYICAWSFSNDHDRPARKIAIAPSQGPGHKPPINVPAAVGGSVAFLVVLIGLFSLCRYTVWRRPLRIFISHSGGPNGAGKNFPSWLHQEMASHRRWSRSKFHVKPFLDVENCPKGLPFAGKILKELERFDVGVVVVAQDFFSRHWPMVELIKFVEVQRNDREGRIRLLPLFYELTPREVKQRLDEGTWENFWRESSEDNHPLQLQECKDAVTWLCNQAGIRYVSHDRDQDKVYIDTILKEVDKILCDERSIAADLRWALKKLNIT